MAETFTYQANYPDAPSSELTATYDPEADNAVSEAHVDNKWPVDGGFVLIQQFSATDPARPDGWDENGVIVFGPESAPAGVVTDIDLTALGIRYATELSPYYGDEYLTVTGDGTLLPAGGEVQLALQP